MTVVSVAVQHHPARAHLLDPLLARLDGLNVRVVADPNPDSPTRSPLRTYVDALRRTPKRATHRLVLQDDAWPCQQFASKMLAAVTEKPEEMVALFAPGCAPHRAKMLRAVQRRERWALLHSLWMPTVAMCWPAALAREFVAEFDASGVDVEKRRGDDGPVGEFCQRHRIRVWATVPSLVEHPDVEVSLIGRPNRAGKNRARVAAVFAE